MASPITREGEEPETQETTGTLIALKREKAQIKQNIFEIEESIIAACCNNVKTVIRDSPVIAVDENCNQDRPDYAVADEPLPHVGPSHDALIRSLEKVKGDLKLYLHHNGFPGRFVSVGSSADGTKVHAKDEFDYIYEISWLIEDIESGSDENSFRLSGVNDFKESGRWSSDEVFRLFCETLENGLETITLPTNLRYGGFSHVLNKSSGLRLNEPAVTLLFLNANGELSIDITPGFLLPEEKAHYFIDKIRTKLETFLTSLQGDVFYFYDKLHLVALYPETREWHVTTSASESQLFQQCPRGLQIKEALRAAKLLNIHYIRQDTSELLRRDSSTINEGTRKIVNYIDTIVGFVEQFLSYSTSGQFEDQEIDEFRRKLARLLSFAHILLPRQRADKYNETTTKGHIAISTIAFKFELLSQALVKLYSKTLDYEILVGAALSGLRESVIKHTFLDYNVKSVTIPYYIALLDQSELQRVVRRTLRHCKQIAAYIEKEVVASTSL